MTDETVLFVYNSYVDLEIISILLGMRESVVDAVSYRIETSNKRFAFRSLWTPSGCARLCLTAVSAHISDYKLSFARKPSRQSATG